jgi:hypothetical protein
MKIKEILDEITATSGTNDKMKVLRKYEDNETLKEVLYLAHSKRVKFYLKQIPAYGSCDGVPACLGWGLLQLEDIQNRVITGGEATARLKNTLESLSEDDADVIVLIIGKSTKINLGTTNINKVFKGLIEKTPYQGAKSFDEKLARDIFKKWGYAYSDVKMDGRYANCLIDNGEIELESRQGEKTFIPMNSKLVKELTTFPDGVLNGELTMVGLDRYTSNGIIASIVDIEGKREERGEVATNKKLEAFAKKHGNYQDNVDRIRYTVWDSITLDDYFNKKSDSPYSRRKYYLVAKTPLLQCTRVSLVESKKVYSYEQAMEHFQEMLLRGEEGTILKGPTAGWKDGKPTWQVKMKLDMNIDLRIVGFEFGEEGTKNENVYSTINLETSCGLLKTNASGMKEVMMVDITERADDLIGTIVEIRCSGLSQNSKGSWSTLHPSVVELRDDKDTCDSLKSAQEVENMAKGLTKIIKG